jgi:hypothetical protein
VVTQVPGSTETPASLTERFGISRGMIMGVGFGLIGCILVVLVIAILILVTTRRRSRRQR